MDWTSWNYIISGGILTGCWAIGLFFFRFWRRGGDHFFAYFGCAFWLLAVERLMLIFVHPSEEARMYIYFVRLIAFLFIIYAIYDKNRGGTPRRPVAPAESGREIPKP